jgi:hypothetical protein
MNELGKSAAEFSLADSWGGITLLFLLFTYFFAGALGYGYGLRRILFPRAPLLSRCCESFLLASLVLWAAAFLLAATHSLRLVPRWAAWLAFLPGVFLFLPLALEISRAVLGKGRRLPAAVFLLVFSVRSLAASLPSQHGDPLLYHLLGPRLWMEAGGFLMHPHLPNALLASSWECLYLWPQLLWFSLSPMHGLVEAQIFSQWLHLFLAWGGSALLVMRLFRGTVRERWLPLSGFAALFVAGLQWTAPLAKNDAGIAFWCLGAIVYFIAALEDRGWRPGLLSGLFSGLAVCGKITALVSLAPILGALLIASRPWKTRSFFPKESASWLSGFAAGSLPVYFRNFLLSGNPFFPLFPRLFPSPWISKSWEAHFSQVVPSSPLHAFPRVLGRAPELLHESPWIPAALLSLFFYSWNRPSRVPLVAACFFSYALFVVTQAPEIELRYLGASLLILSAGGACFLLRIAERLPAGRAPSAAAFLLLAGMLASSRLPLHVARKIWASPLGAEFLKSHSAGEAKAWIRANAGDGFTVLAGDNETYYLTPVGVTVLTERSDLDEANAQTDFPRFVQVLCRLTHARYLLDARPKIGVGNKFGAAALAPAMVFSGQGAQIYDLRRLEAMSGVNPRNCR